jgi:hypothetical protein
MKKIDWVKERARLTDLYARMEDGELEKIGANPDTLTAVARQVLAVEMSKRGMQLPEPPLPAVEVASPVAVRRYRDLPQAAMAQVFSNPRASKAFLPMRIWFGWIGSIPMPWAGSK